MAKMSKDKIKEMPKNILNILKYTKTHKQRFSGVFMYVSMGNMDLGMRVNIINIKLRINNEYERYIEVMIIGCP